MGYKKTTSINRNVDDKTDGKKKCHCYNEYLYV